MTSYVPGIPEWGIHLQVQLGACSLLPPALNLPDVAAPRPKKQEQQGFSATGPGGRRGLSAMLRLQRLLQSESNHQQLLPPSQAGLQHRFPLSGVRQLHFSLIRGSEAPKVNLINLCLPAQPGGLELPHPRARSLPSLSQRSSPATLGHPPSLHMPTPTDLKAPYLK